MSPTTHFRSSLLSVSLVALALTASANAALYQYFASFGGGFSAFGMIETKADAPASFLELHPTPPSGVFATTYVQSMFLQVFNGTTTLSSGHSVFDGLSSDRWLHMQFDANPTPIISEIDTSTQQAGVDSYYYISNGINPAGAWVNYGETTFNLFQYTTSTSTTTYIGSTNTLMVSLVPSPGAAGLMALSGYVAMRRRRGA
jgi:hypothetical protein